MNLGLENKSVLVMAAGSGIGQGVALEFAKEKANVMLSNVFRMGIMGMTKTLSRELGPDHVLINVVGPGKIATDRVRHLDSIKAEKEGVSPEVFQQKNAKTIPLGRYGSTGEIAKAVVFLCSEANTYITGQSLLVDGGMVKTY
ncbi:MAG: SDR family oxidoreductase [Desulfobacterales bacterium]|nr:SDR family oxidoreductase [Desulfobacterales bacterium]